MTTWTYKVGNPSQVFLNGGGKQCVSAKHGIVDIELDRGGIRFKGAGEGIPDTCVHLFIGQNNELQLLFFAQQLISIIAETNPSWVKKNHIAVSAKAIVEYIYVP